MPKGADLQQFFADLAEAVNSAVPTLPRRGVHVRGWRLGAALCPWEARGI